MAALDAEDLIAPFVTSLKFYRCVFASINAIDLGLIYQPEIGMRLIYILIIASIVGSAGVSAVRTVLTNRQTETAEAEPAVRTVIRLYGQDKAAATVLMERASVSCLPELSKVASKELRTVIPRMMSYAVTAKVRGEKLDKAEFRETVIKMVVPAARNASPADLEVMDRIVNKPSKGDGAVVDCIINTMAQLSRSDRPSQPKGLLEDVKLRGS